MTTRNETEKSSQSAEPARFGVLEGGTPSESGTMITRTITLAKCLRCGFEWLPRVECPVKCPHCRTPLWNVPRANILPGKPAPTRKGKPRGRSLPKEQKQKRAEEKANS